MWFFRNVPELFGKQAAVRHLREGHAIPQPDVFDIYANGANSVVGDDFRSRNVICFNRTAWMTMGTTIQNEVLRRIKIS